MTLILENLGKLFQPKYKNLDAKFWIQKVILKKEIFKKEEILQETEKIIKEAT